MVAIELPPKLVPVFASNARYKGAWGGRGGAKTRPFAKMTAVDGYKLAMEGREGILLCAREHLNSLDESSLQEVKLAISSEPWLLDFYEIGERYVRTKCGRINYAFAGLRHNLDGIKSKAAILRAWVDEAENVSEMAWQKLIPTVREPGSQIWATWNPEREDSATHKRLRVNPPADAMIVEMNWRDNPWFPDVLEQERQADLRNRPDIYDHIWEGGFFSVTDAQVFANKFRIDEFEPGAIWDGPYQGGDFGFSVDPTAALRCYIHKNRLYISHEAYKHKLELDDTVDFVGQAIPEWARYVSRWDSARPESISFLKRHAMPLAESVSKWAGSVEDGVQFLRAFEEIIIHPRCTHTAREFRLYSYKTDRLTGDPLPVLADQHNHTIDALRYALAPMIRSKSAPRIRAL